MASANYNLPLKDGWKFHLGEFERVADFPISLSHATSKAGGALKALDGFEDEPSWKAVCVPHDWLTELSLDKNEIAAGGFKKRKAAWYSLSFNLGEDEIKNAKLVFDGVLGKCDVYVNGTLVGRNFSGYNRFGFDVSDYLLPGQENKIALYVDARRWEGWWYEGAGLYRDVYIQFRADSYFDEEKCFVKAFESGTEWKVQPELDIVNANGNMNVRLSLVDKEGKIVAADTFDVKEKNISLSVLKPELWSPETPNLYTLICELEKEGAVLDTFKTQVGFRAIEWKANEGMFLNGKRYQIKGICCHQDHAGVGAAMPKELMEHRIGILKKLGINAYRCAHHAVSESLLEICDRMGMLVMVENRNFAVSEEVLEQLSSLVYVSRNHPSVFLYGLFNEEPWQEEERGMRIAQKMRAHVLKLDNTRPIIGAQNAGLLADSNTSDVLDVIGVNYCLKDYDAAHERLSDKVIIGTENCPTYATRGVYKSDKEKYVFASYGDEWPEYFSESLTETMHTAFYKPYVAGCFAWSGFDYRGEPTPYEWPSALSHWGFTDYCGFAKDTAYQLAAWYKDDLFAHLFPHWNHKAGEMVRVCTFTNADTAELFVNGRSLGKKEVTDRRAEWEAVFEPGIIKVAATKGNKTVYDEVKTAKDAAKICLIDVTPNKENASVHIVNICITDEDGTVIPDCDALIKFDVQKGTILGVGNGDPNSHHDEKAHEIKLFNGWAQVICVADELAIKSEGLPDVNVYFNK